MPRVPICIPAEGWGGAAVQLPLWLVEIGDEVDAADPLAELQLPGVIGDLMSPATGRIVELQSPSDRWWTAGEVVGWIETAEETPL